MPLIEEEITLEQIGTQRDDWFIPSAENAFKDIRSYLKTTKRRNFRDKKLREIFDVLDDLIYKRFGFKTRHIESTYGGYAIYPPASEAYDYLGDFSKEVYDEIEDWYGDKEFNVKDINNSDDENPIMRNYLKVIRSVTKKLNTTGIKIDLNKAYITNFPKDVEIIAMCGFDMLDGDLTELELVSVLLHEIGHTFTRIEYMYQSMGRNNTLLEAINSSIEDKLTPTETLLLVNKELFDDSVDLKNSTELGKTLRIVNEVVTQERIMLEPLNVYATTDSEALADGFATRFGLGKELSVALSKVMDKKNFVVILKAKLTSFFTLLGIVKMLIERVALSVIVASTLLSVVVGILFIVLIYSIFPQYTYDDDDDRFNRIRNDIIRQLRLGEYKRNEVDKVLNDLDVILDIINKYRGSNFYMKVSKYLPWNLKSTWNRNDEQLLENMLENELHVGGHKLRLLGEKI